jgi:hypothetical protein
MKRGELRQGWREMGEEILEGLEQWREEHSRATMREIEDEIDKRLSALRAQMISDTANAMSARDGRERRACSVRTVERSW